MFQHGMLANAQVLIQNLVVPCACKTAGSWHMGNIVRRDQQTDLCCLQVGLSVQAILVGYMSKHGMCTECVIVAPMLASSRLLTARQAFWALVQGGHPRGRLPCAACRHMVTQASMLGCSTHMACLQMQKGLLTALPPSVDASWSRPPWWRTCQSSVRLIKCRQAPEL